MPARIVTVMAAFGRLYLETPQTEGADVVKSLRRESLATDLLVGRELIVF
jgi:hypothetical protein